MRLIRNHVFVGLAVLAVLAICNAAAACTVELDIPKDSVLKGSKDEAVPMDILVLGTDSGTVTFARDYSGDGRVEIWNNAKTATVSWVNVSDCPVRLWVQGTAGSSTVGDVKVTATLKDTEDQTLDTHDDTVTVLTVDLDIDGVDDEKEESLGGLVVRNHDGNNAARKKIILRQAEPNGNVILTRSSENVKVYDAPTGGTQITFTEGDNEFSSLPKNLYVQGHEGSASMLDVTLTLTPGNGGGLSDKVKFTVLWVDISWKRLSTDKVPTDNSRFLQYIVTTGDDELGLLDESNGFRSWWYQIEGEVSPHNFDQDKEIDWSQDVQRRAYENNGFLATRKDFSAQFPPGNDPLADSFKDKQPQSGGSGGKVYYLDGPGMLRNSAKPINTVRRYRGNFKVAALYTGHGYTNQRCSEIWTHYVRFSMKKTDAPPGNTWVDPADVANDKQANSGSFTKLSWDLNSPTVTGITPNNGTNDGTVNITNLAGTSFVDGATIKLTKAGEAEIVATNPSYESVTKITCTFDLTGKAAGQWNVVVINPGDESNPGTLGNGFTITEP